MYQHSGPKKIGRFIKKDSVTSKRVRISEYNFGEICEVNVVLPDNSYSNLILKDLHENSELQKIKKASIDDSLADVRNNPPIMPLRDFTKEWLDNRDKAKSRRNTLYDEDDDVETMFSSKKENIESQSENQIEESHLQEEDEFEEQMIVQQKVNPPVNKMDHTKAEIQLQNQLASEGQKSSQMNFVPMQMPTHNETDEPTFVEDEAIEEYHRQKILESIDIEGIKEEAKAIGYEDGYRTGEEKATIEVRQKADEIFSKVSSLINEFENLKKEIFENVQSNFHEIAQAMCEAIIERSIDLDPAIFASIMRRAINESVEDEHFKIHVHPKTEQSIRNLNLDELKGRLVADSKVEQGNFRIETSLGMVNSGIKKIIQDLLEEANIQLFETENKTIKAG